MSIEKGSIFPTSSSLGEKARRVRAYMCDGFPFVGADFNYEDYWDRLSEDTNRPVLEVKLRFIESLVDKGSSVLDIGCGDGALLHHLHQAKGIEAYGIETSESAIQLATQKGISVKKADVSQKEFELRDTYDFIIASEVIEHLVKPEELMAKLKGKFRKQLIITIPNTGFLGERLRLVCGRFPKQWVLHPSEHLRFWTVTDFVFWCDQLGYNVDRYYGLLDEYYNDKINLWKYYPRLFSRYIVYTITEKS